MALAVGNKIDVKPLFLKYGIFTCPTIPAVVTLPTERTRCDHTLGHLWHGFVSTKNAHRVDTFSQFEPQKIHFWPHKNRRHAEHLCIYFTIGLLRRFRRSSANAPYGDALIPMVIVLPKYTPKKRRLWKPKSWRCRGTFSIRFSFQVPAVNFQGEQASLQKKPPFPKQGACTYLNGS